LDFPPSICSKAYYLSIKFALRYRSGSRWIWKSKSKKSNEQSCLKHTNGFKFYFRKTRHSVLLSFTLGENVSLIHLYVFYVYFIQMFVHVDAWIIYLLHAWKSHSYHFVMFFECWELPVMIEEIKTRRLERMVGSNLGLNLCYKNLR
jgi:hypothetical protein